MITIVYKHRHFINLGVCLTWDKETPYWVKAAPTFCGPHDHYSRKKARELGIKRCLKYGQYIVPTKTLHALEMLDRVTPRDHKSHKWIKSFVMALLGGEESTLVPVQISQKTFIEVIKKAFEEHLMKSKLSSNKLLPKT